MKLVFGRPVVTLELARGETLSLDDALGVRITGRSGVVWVTQERSGSDDFVCAGTSLTVSEPGRTVVEALERGVLQLSRRNIVLLWHAPVRVMAGCSHAVACGAWHPRPDAEPPMRRL